MRENESRSKSLAYVKVGGATRATGEQPPALHFLAARAACQHSAAAVPQLEVSQTVKQPYKQSISGLLTVFSLWVEALHHAR